MMHPNLFNIRREAREWTDDEFEARIDHAPEKIEWVGGIFTSEKERLTVLEMLLETLGIDAALRFGQLEDWEAAVAERRRHQTDADPH